MILKDQICKAFCSGITVRQVPMGLVIATSIAWLDGDMLAFYARSNGSMVRFEDSGSSIFDLETNGVDLSSPSRMAIIEGLCKEYNVIYDETDCQFQTDWVDEQSAGYTAIQFLSFLTRLQDLTFTAKERVARTFRDDLIAALEKEFANDAEVVISEAPVPDLSYYTVDIVVKHRDGKTAAIFPGTGEQKALEAILFAKELELKRIANVVPFLVVEEDGSKISKHTKAKALNSELTMAAWDGGEKEVVDKIRKHLTPLAA